MRIQLFTVNPVQENTYLLWDEESLDAAVIDCGVHSQTEREQLAAFLADHGLQLRMALQTHCHFDHIMGLSYIYNAYCITPRCHPAEQEVYEMMPIMAQKYFGIQLDLPLPPLGEPLREGNVVELGQIRLHVIHTPGHTPGGICLHEPYHKVLFSGDTLFRGSLGRTDLGGNMIQELSSIRNKILTLPTDTRILPGHGPETDVAWESNHNPYLC